MFPLQYSTDLKYYLKYAMAAYGWPIHVYLNPIRGPASLCISARCQCCCARCQEPHFEGNTCFPHQAAIKAMTGVEEENIITASFVNLIDIVPFFVVRVDDGERKEVVVAIRGTLSIKVSRMESMELPTAMFSSRLKCVAFYLICPLMCCLSLCEELGGGKEERGEERRKGGRKGGKGGGKEEKVSIPSTVATDKIIVCHN